MRVVRASRLGMCFGVREAIRKVLAAAAREPVTVLGELVHNQSVLAGLARRGIGLCREAAEAPAGLVAITAHGASDRRRAELRARGARVLDATCPIVRAAHRAVQALAADGFHPVVLGRPGHVEVRGLTEDLAAFDVVSCEADVDRLDPRPRFGLAAQTTQPLERLDRVAARIRERFPLAEVRVAETVCVPTRLRQEAAARLAASCDVVVVAGDAHSNNTRELCGTCRRHCGRVFLVQSARDLEASWFAGARVAGLTAGASTPDEVVDEVEAAMREVGRRRAVA